MDEQPSESPQQSTARLSSAKVVGCTEKMMGDTLRYLTDVTLDGESYQIKRIHKEFERLHEKLSTKHKNIMANVEFPTIFPAYKDRRHTLKMRASVFNDYIRTLLEVDVLRQDGTLISFFKKPAKKEEK
jgi:hypothetical protein